MKRTLACIVAAALLSGCSTRYQVNAASNTGVHPAPPPAGTTVTSGSAGLQVQSSGSAAVALFAIALIAGAIEYARAPRPLPSPSAILPETPMPAPQLAPARRVHEQDCGKPVEDWSANLKCR